MYLLLLPFIGCRSRELCKCVASSARINPNPNPNPNRNASFFCPDTLSKHGLLHEPKPREIIIETIPLVLSSVPCSPVQLTHEPKPAFRHQ